MVDSKSRLSQYSKVSKQPVIKKTKYEGEDQILFGELKSGDIFNHLPYVYPGELKDYVTCPYTIKTDEKTRLMIINKEGVSK